MKPILLYRIIYVIFIIASFSPLAAQTKSEAPQRYQIVQTDNLGLESDSLSYAFPDPAGNTHNYILLDSQTGQSWLLGRIWDSAKESSGGPAFIRTVAWKPLLYDDSISKVETKFQLSKTHRKLK